MTKKEFLKRIEKAKELVKSSAWSGACHSIDKAFNCSYLKDEDELDMYDIFNYIMNFKLKSCYWFPVGKEYIKTRCEMIDHFADTIIELGWHKFIELEG